jgi:DNA-binding PadR family transcriptional regulator
MPVAIAFIVAMLLVLGAGWLDRCAWERRRTLRLLAFLRDHRDEEFGGSDLMEQVRMSSGHIYVILGELQDQGFVSSRWEELPEGETRPRRRFYRITPQGETADALRFARFTNG